MAESAVTFLLNKLARILQEEEDLFRGFRGNLVWIKDEMEQMNAFLRVADSMEEDGDEGLKAWVKQLRNAAQDTEDVLDEFQLHRHHDHAKGCLPTICSTNTRVVHKFKTRRQTAIAIVSIRTRVISISESFQRYRIQLEEGAASTRSNICYDRRADARLIEEAELVGIEEPKRQLIELLLEGASRKFVVSVLGMGGLGKTTLVKRVYDDVNVKSRFQSHVWINVSQSFKLDELLKDIIRQLFDEVNQPEPERLQTMNRDQLKDKINVFLKEKSYVLVLDDIWTIMDWDDFKYVLPNNNFNSRVMLTTRVKDVASKSCFDTHGHIFELQRLSPEKSWSLFCTKTFHTESCPAHLVEMSESILKRCEGLPLAIVAISGVLATKDPNKIDEWEMVQRSLGDELESNDGLKSLRKIVLLGFHDLPYYLKSCFLYLSVFPEDCIIDRMRLIRLWMAEGFVLEKPRKTQEEVADSYLNELLNRSMIQVEAFTLDGRVKTCRIHDLIREIMLSKSKDQILVEGNQLNSRWPERIRSISIHNNVVTNIQPLQSSECHLRSLLMFGLTGSLHKFVLPSFFSARLKLLTVLDFGGAHLELFPEEIVQLYNLRYLSLRDTKVSHLPNSIGKLVNLETLDLKRSNITELPANISKLKQLRHLLLYHYTPANGMVVFPSLQGFKALSGIGGLTALQKLNSIQANPCSGGSIVKEIGMLRQLTRLGITQLRKEDGKDLCSSMQNLPQLRSLTLLSIQEDEILDLQYLSSPPPYLRSLHLNGRLEKLPNWIPLAGSLVTLLLWWSRLKEDPLQSLGDLPNLVCLRLRAVYDGETLCFKTGSFQRLKELHLAKLKELRNVRLEDGTMPKLEELYIGLCNSLERVPSGIETLSNLNLLQFVEMPEKLIEMIQRKHESGVYSKTLAHIPRVEVLYRSEDGALQGYFIQGKNEIYVR